MPADFAHQNAQPFALEAGENAILLLHGFTGSPSHMRPIADACHRAGFSARGILLPGHGSTLDDMRKSNDAQWLDAAKTAYQEMKQRYKKVSVGGLSMGGLLSLLLAEAFDPAALILFAPAIRYASAINHLSPVAKYVLPVSPWHPRAFEAGEFLYEYDHGYEGAPVSKVEDMTRLQRAARKGLSEITCPTLVIQSHHDESVHRTGPEIITRGVSARVKEIAWVDASSHVCTIGPDRAYVNERVIDFLSRFGV
ncbi:MAG: alpha/beta fold hydrolase [Oscillospiraceae bacterium]|jgi:carboxylesterase|nr:alpha/beta fold hydrolase [Oscillospiraceae bacterium]